MATWATNTKRDLIPGTIGITITVIEYDSDTNSYRTVSSAAYPPTADLWPAASYRRPESAPVSPVRPFVTAALTEPKPGRGTRRRSPASDGDER